MSRISIFSSNYCWTLEQTCELIVFVASAVLAVYLVRGPLEPVLATWLGRTLETRIPNTDLEHVSKIDGIIVLGGSAKRVAAALEIAEIFSDVPVVLSGPGDSEIRSAYAHLSHAPERLVVDRRPKSTYQNALQFRDYISPNVSTCWILVTSAIHMPRALGTFQAMSLPVVPWLVDDTPSVPKWLSGPVWHELRGLIAYRVLGITDELFPHLKLRPPCLMAPRE